MTIEEALTMLRDPDAQVDMEGLISLLESQQEIQDAVDDLFGSEDVRRGVRAVKRDREFLSELETESEKHSAVVSKLQSVIDGRKAKMIDHCVGRLELLGKDPDRFKTRSQKMDFEDLDAELDDLNDQLRQMYKVERVTGGNDEVEILSADISQYRV